MMKSNTHLRRVILFLGFLLFSGMIMSGCNSPNEKINSAELEHDLIEKLQKDSLIIAFNKIQGKLDLAIASNKFNLLHYDRKMIDNNIKKCRTPEQTIALYKRAGMTHAREYYSLTRSKIGIAFLLRRKYPELYKLPRSVRFKVFEAVIKPDVSIAALADSAKTHFH